MRDLSESDDVHYLSPEQAHAVLAQRRSRSGRSSRIRLHSVVLFTVAVLCLLAALFHYFV
jgi:hypothetical protein